VFPSDYSKHGDNQFSRRSEQTQPPAEARGVGKRLLNMLKRSKAKKDT
jgi:hypothetical protein